MRRLLIYIGLSVALHVFAVWPLLAEQFAVADDAAVNAVAGAQTSALKLPALVQKAVMPESKVTPVMEPAVTPKVQPNAQAPVESAPQTQPKPAVQAKPQTQVKPEPQAKPELQAQPEPVAKRPPPQPKPAEKTPQPAKPTPPQTPPAATLPVEEVRKAQPQLADAADATQVQPAAAAEPRESRGTDESISAQKPSAPQAQAARDAQSQGAAASPAQSSTQPSSTQEVTSTQPRFARAPAPPHYPAQAKRRQQQGTVWVEVRLDRRGKLVDVQVLRSSGVSSLDQAALAAVRRWQFLPEQRGGVGVPSRVHIPIEFAIAANR